MISWMLGITCKRIDHWLWFALDLNRLCALKCCQTPEEQITVETAVDVSSRLAQTSRASH